MNNIEVKKMNEEFLKSFFSREKGMLFNLNAKDLVKFIPDNFIQTIYFDPPFSNNPINDIPHPEDRIKGDYENYVWFVDGKRSFLSTCEAYIKEFHRTLKDSGSVFLHLPWNLAYDVKPIADRIFGSSTCLRNEIVWTFRRWETNTQALQQNHHTILWYVKNPELAKFTRLEMPRTQETLKRFGAGKIVSAVDPETGKRVPSKTEGKSTTTSLNDVWVYDGDSNKWLYELDEIDENTAISNLKVMYGISHTAPIKKLKSIGTGQTYPFEKPLALIDRLIKLSSDKPNDIVLDLFAGTGIVADACIKNNRKYLVNEISKFTTLDIINKISYSKLVPGFPLYSHPNTIGKELGKINGREFEFWAGYSLGGISDDSFRGRDSHHGLDVIVPVGPDEYVVGEVKKELRLMDEWYKIKSKAEKLLAAHPGFQNRYAVVASHISLELQHEMQNHPTIKFIPIIFETDKLNYLLRDQRVENRLVLDRANAIESTINVEFIERKKVKKKKAR